MVNTRPVTIHRLFSGMLGLALVGCAATTPVGPEEGLAIKLNLPRDMDWIQVTNLNAADHYTHAWIPRGSNPQNAEWTIREEKLTLGFSLAAAVYLRELFGEAKRQCNNVSINGPIDKPGPDYQMTVGRYLCARRLGKNYGTSTDVRVMTQNRLVYVVTSEIRVPASNVAGALSVTAGGADQDIRQMLRWQEQSAMFVRRSIDICDGWLVVC